MPKDLQAPTIPTGPPAASSETRSAEELEDRQIFDLILSGHPPEQILAYIAGQGHAQPNAIAVRAVQRYVSQVESVTTSAQCGFLLDTYRELARQSTEIGDFQGARACLKDYFAVVRYVAACHLAHDPEEPGDDAL